MVPKVNIQIMQRKGAKKLVKQNEDQKFCGKM